MPKIEHLRLSDLLTKRHPGNPKEHNLPELVDSFRRFGFVAFPTLDEKTDTLVAGHGRCEALAAMKAESDEAPPPGIDRDEDGEWLVPVVRGVSFASERERDAYILADNQHVIGGGWKFEALGEWLQKFGATPDSDGFLGLGFPAVDLDSLLGNFSPEPELAEEPEPPEGFVKHDINVTTTYCCPKCAYEWSGKPK